MVLDAAIAAVEAELGPISILVANAGITKDTLLLRMSDEEFESVVDTNLNGVFRIVKRVIKSMLKQKFGRVILIGSVVGLLGSAGQVNYSSTKSALVGMARSITREIGAKNITANVVAPGVAENSVSTPLHEIPMGRLALLQEIAQAVLFFVREPYLTGQVLEVAGGWNL